MNRINRSLVKTQARQMIKGKVFYLFLISFIVSVLTGAGVSVNFNLSTFDSLHNSNDFFGNYFDDYDYDDDYFDSFGYDESDNPIEDFEFNSKSTGVRVSNLASENEVTQAKTASVFPALAGFGSILAFAGLIFAPLTVTLAGMYVSFVRRNANENFELGTELGGIFKNSFNNTYLNKLLVTILRDIIMTALCILFIVPGIIFYYSSYFALQIMNDYPNLKPMEAIKLSKKIIKGNRSELFVYDLSFIPWYLLTAITFGIAGIYVTPYKSTSDALYYENFRLRALAEGRITQDDFLSEGERFMKYNSVNYNDPNQQNGYYNPTADNGQNTGYQSYQTYQAPSQNVINNDGTFFTPDFSPVQQYNPYANPAQPNPPQSDGGYYYSSQQPTDTAAPAQPAGSQNDNPPAEPEQYYKPADEQTTSPSYYNPPQDTDSYTENNDNHYE